MRRLIAWLDVIAKKPLEFWAVQTILMATLATLFWTMPSSGQFWWGDAGRHAMNGLFYLDLFKNLPFSDPMKWALSYYVKYPCITAVYYPPLFHLAEALMFALLGVSARAAYLTVVLFSLLGALGTYGLARRWMDRWPSLAAALLYLSVPIDAFWGREVALEMPAYVGAIWASLLTFRYLDHRRIATLLWAVTAFALALYTKQLVAFAGFPLVYLLWKAEGPRLWKSPRYWLAAGLFCIEMVPLIVVMLKFGSLNFTYASSGTSGDLSLWAFDSWSFYLRALPKMLGWPLLALLPALGTAWMLSRTRKRNPLPDSLSFARFSTIWLVSGYLFFTFLRHKEIRYGIHILFPIYLALPMVMVLLLPKQQAAVFAMALALASVTGNVILTSGPWITGYEHAADLLAEQMPKGGMALLFADRDADLVFNLRAHGDREDISFLRADKILTDYTMNRADGIQQANLTQAQVGELLDRYGVSYAVFEPDFWDDLEVIRKLGDELNSDHFTRVGSVPVDSNQKHSERELLIYRNNHPVHPDPNLIKLKLRMIGLEVGGNK